jgi:hypothetical protein
MLPEQVSCLSWISPTKGYPQYREEKCVPESVSVNPRYRKIPQQSSSRTYRPDVELKKAPNRHEFQ